VEVNVKVVPVTSSVPKRKKAPYRVSTTKQFTTICRRTSYGDMTYFISQRGDFI